MKNYFFSIAVFLLPLTVTNQSSCEQQAAGESSSSTKTVKSFFPLAAGNYWIYRDSTFSGGKLVSVANDTDKIISESKWNGKKTYVFDDQKEWFASGDTIYQLTMQRTQVKYPTPVMLVSDVEASFNYAYGGDVVMQRKVSKMASCPPNKWNPSMCYKISDACNGYVIIGAGVGILRDRTSDCLSEAGNYSTRTLIDAFLK